MTDENGIRARAYHIWLDAGRPNGQADEHWRLAELALSMEMVGHVARTSDHAPAPAKPARKSGKTAGAKGKKKK